MEKISCGNNVVCAMFALVMLICAGHNAWAQEQQVELADARNILDEFAVDFATLVARDLRPPDDGSGFRNLLESRRSVNVRRTNGDVIDRGFWGIPDVVRYIIDNLLSQEAYDLLVQKMEGIRASLGEVARRVRMTEFTLSLGPPFVTVHFEVVPSSDQ